MPAQDSTAASVERELRAACLGMERRLLAGEECSAEELLSLYSELAAESDAALELIFAEFTLRRQRGEQLSTHDWCERFPQWRERLERLFHVYELMGAEGSLGTAAGEDTAGDEAPGDRGQLPVVSGHRGPGALLVGEGERRIGNYEVLEEIARGGMGVVYKARHLALNRLVALKLILAGEYAGLEHRARFRREAEAAARLQHPGIVQLFEIGEQDGLPFLAMEYVAGPRLDQILGHQRDNGFVGLPPREAAQLVQTLAKAIHHAHEQGVIHRDLKPANVLLQTADCRLQIENRGDASGRGQSAIHNLQSAIPKIADFGLAKRLNESRAETRTGMLLGTPSYMAPEQAAGRSAEIGPATDIFALGVMLYELLAGSLPFQGISIEDTLHQVQSRDPIRPSQLQRGVPRDLETICLKCLEKEPAKHYISAAALADDLRRFLNHEAILARPAGRAERAWRWCRRNPTVAALTGGIALLLMCASVLSSTLGIWAWKEKRRADEYAAQEQAARELADHRFKLAENAVERYLDGIENNPRLREADFHDLRKQLLASAIPFYEEFVQSKPGDDRLDARRGQAYNRLAMLRSELGESEKALADFLQMRACFEKLRLAFPDNSEYGRQLALCHINTGVLLRKIGRHDEALTHYRQAMAILEELAGQTPTAVEVRNDLARSHSNLANLMTLDRNMHAAAAAHHRRAIALRKELMDELPSAEQQRGLAGAHLNFGIFWHEAREYRKAESEHREAVRLFEGLAAGDPTNPRYHAELATAEQNLGVCLAKLGESLEARSLCQQAIARYRALADEFPAVPDFRFYLARAHFNLAKQLNDGKMPEQAEVEYRESLRIGSELVKAFPDVVDYQSAVANALNNLAVLAHKANRWPQARSLYQRAIEHQRKAYETLPTHSIYARSLSAHYIGLAESARQMRDHAASAEAAAGLVSILPDAADDALWAARFLGRCVVLAEQDAALAEGQRRALAQSYADQAMGYLSEAVRRGYNNAAELKKLEALAPLRSRPDFQELISRLESR